MTVRASMYIRDISRYVTINKCLMLCGSESYIPSDNTTVKPHPKCAQRRLHFGQIPLSNLSHKHLISKQQLTSLQTQKQSEKPCSDPNFSSSLNRWKLDAIGCLLRFISIAFPKKTNIRWEASNNSQKKPKIEKYRTVNRRVELGPRSNKVIQYIVTDYRNGGLYRHCIAPSQQENDPRERREQLREELTYVGGFRIKAEEAMTDGEAGSGPVPPGGDVGACLGEGWGDDWLRRRWRRLQKPSSLIDIAIGRERKEG